MQNIGVFEDTIIEFPEKTDPNKAEIHILIGENSTGKTTVLCALAGLTDLDPHLPLRFRYTDERSKFTVSTSKAPVGFTYTFNQQSGSFAGTYSPEIIDYKNKIKNYRQTNFSFAFFAYSGHRSLESIEIFQIKELETSPFVNSLNFINSDNPALLMQWIANTKTKEALESLKNGEGNPDRYRKAIKRIQDAIIEIISTKIEFVFETDPFDVMVRIGSKQLSIDVLPDGLKAIISWIADLLMRMDRIRWASDVEVLDRNFILFLDEIDVHLHPAWQRKILPAVQKLFKNAQIFVSTHSPFVVGSVDGAWVHKLVLDEKGNSHAEPPRRSEDGESYQYILKEVFNIDEQFGVGTEGMLAQFRDFKSKILQGENYDREKFLKLAHDIAVQSIELSSIIGMELRQLSRITQADFSI